MDLASDRVRRPGIAAVGGCDDSRDAGRVITIGPADDPSDDGRMAVFAGCPEDDLEPPQLRQPFRGNMAEESAHRPNVVLPRSQHRQ